jgi:type I restriction enzyme S subunit
MGKTPARKEQKYWGKGHKWVSIRDLSQKIVSETKEEITDFALKESGIKMVSKGTLLFSFKLTIGKMAFAGTNLYTNEAIAAFVIKDPKKVESNYLYYALQSVNLVGSNQAAMGKTLNSKSLAAIEIPLPDNINDQKRIAQLLGKVEGVINQRKQNIQKLNDLLKSVFWDMFGDPVGNEKGWDVQPCDQIVINIQSGTSYGGDDKGFLEKDELGVLKISAVTKGYLDKREFKAVKKSVVKKKLRFIKKGDLLFSRANTVELVAACCVVNHDSETLFLPDKLWALTLAKGINIQYFNFLLKNKRFRNKVRSLASGGHDSMLNISMKKFLTLDVPNPDEKLQNHFASIVEKVESIKSHYQQNLSDLEALYGSLSQKAFKGDLDLSNIPLLEELDATVESANQFTDEFISDPSTDAKPLIMPFNTYNEYPLSDPISRRQVLEYAFATFLNNIPIGDEISLAEFWQTLLWQAGDYADETDLPFNVNDYDLVKKQLFQAIADGKVEQQINKIQLQNEVTDGNQILLKKLG